MRIPVGHLGRVVSGEKKYLYDGNIPLQRVKDESCDRQPFRTSTGDICCSDVAASGSPNVLATKKTHEQIAERDRPEQIRDENEDEGVDQRYSEALIAYGRSENAARFS